MSRSCCGRSPASARCAGSARRSGPGTADQPHIAPVLESLRRIAAMVAVGPVECRPVTVSRTPAAALAV